MKDEPFNPAVHKARDYKTGSSTPYKVVPDGKGGYMNDPNDPDAYNCHSDAWHGGAGDPSDPRNANSPPNWDNNPSDEMERATKLDPDEPNTPGDVVVYGNDIDGDGLDPDEITHSATVIEVDAQGNTTYVRSKEGPGPVTFHHPTQAQPSYGTTREYYNPETAYSATSR
jgi:hypothetical protein